MGFAKCRYFRIIYPTGILSLGTVVKQVRSGAKAGIGRPCSQLSMSQAGFVAFGGCDRIGSWSCSTEQDKTTQGLRGEDGQL